MCMTDSRVSESKDVVMTYKVVQNDGMDVGFAFKQKNIQICNGFVTAGRSGSNRSKKDVSFWTGRRLRNRWNFEIFFSEIESQHPYLSYEALYRLYL